MKGRILLIAEKKEGFVLWAMHQMVFIIKFLFGRAEILYFFG
jgi:hypothetical protein